MGFGLVFRARLTGVLAIYWRGGGPCCFKGLFKMGSSIHVLFLHMLAAQNGHTCMMSCVQFEKSTLPTLTHIADTLPQFAASGSDWPGLSHSMRKAVPLTEKPQGLEVED